MSVVVQVVLLSFKFTLDQCLSIIQIMIYRIILSLLLNSPKRKIIQQILIHYVLFLVIPEKFLKALQGWNSLDVKDSAELVPSILKNLKADIDSSNLHITTVVGLAVGSLITSHVEISTYSKLLKGLSVKNLIIILICNVGTVILMLY